MADIYLQSYMQECKSRYAPEGFVRTRQTWSRIVNDVLQTFTLKRFCRGCISTIEFGVFPLCNDVLFVDMGLYSLERFVPALYGRESGWLYDKNSAESVCRSIDAMLHTVDAYLMPLFRRANSSSTALPALIGLDKLFEQKRLSLIGEPIPINCGEELSLMCSEKYYLALKAGDYAFAKKYLHFHIALNERNLETLSPTAYQAAQQKARYIAKLSELNKHRAMLAQGNYEYFSGLLKSNEMRNLENMYKLSAEVRKNCGDAQSVPQSKITF